MRLSLLCLLWCLWVRLLPAQVATDPGVLAGFSYAVQFPGGDLAVRFGHNFSAGLGVSLITPKSQLIFGLEGLLLFGDQVKTDVLANLRTPEGFLIANDKSYTEIFLRERGFYLGAQIGKIFGLLPDNPRSGIRVDLGVGLLQHKIRIQDDPLRVVPQLAGDYKKGYDRLTNGLSFKQFVGYQHLATDRLLNFYAGFEFLQAFTRSRRDFDFDSRSHDAAGRLDLLWGFRVGWVLPFYLIPKDREIFY